MAETVRCNLMPHNLIDRHRRLRILQSLSMSNVKHQVSSTELSSNSAYYRRTKQHTQCTRADGECVRIERTRAAAGIKMDAWKRVIDPPIRVGTNHHIHYLARV